MRAKNATGMGRKGTGLEVLCGVKNARNTGGRCFNVHCALSVGNGVCCTAKAIGAHRNAVAVALLRDVGCS